MSIILDAPQIRRTITRLAYQLWEANFGETALRLVGLAGGGGQRLAELLRAELAQVCPALRVELTSLALHKDAPVANPVTLTPPADSFVDEVVVVVDDVLNTGRTLAYAVAEVLRRQPRRVQTLLLVDRHHPQFPIAATFTGLSLATTLANHVRVELPENGEFSAWLV